MFNIRDISNIIFNFIFTGSISIIIILIILLVMFIYQIINTKYYIINYNILMAEILFLLVFKLNTVNGISLSTATVLAVIIFVFVSINTTSLRNTWKSNINL